MEKGNNDVTVKVSAENMEKLFNVLAKSAFESLEKGTTSWGSYNSNNPFYNIVKEVFKENEAEIKKEIGDILIGIVKSDGFRDAIKVEYTALLADSMLSQISKR